MATLPAKSVGVLSVAHERYLLLLTAAMTMSGVALFVAAPMSAAFVLPLCAIFPVAWHWFAERRLPRLQVSPLMGWLTLAGVYLIINASWSLTSGAFFAGIEVFVLVVTVHLTVTALRMNENRSVQAMAAGFYAGMLIVGPFLCFELLSNQLLRRHLMDKISWLGLDPRHLIMEGDTLIALPSYLLNRSFAEWTMLFWPAVLALMRLGLTRRQRIGLMAAGLLPGTIAVSLSHHGTSKVAFLGAAAAFVAFLSAPIMGRRLLIAGWVVATLLMVPLASMAYSSKLYLAPWLPPSAQDRIVLWGYMSSQVWEAPLLGVGVNTSSVQARQARQVDPDVPRAPGTPYRLSIRHHAHNAYLQVWYETGAVGALLLCVVGILTLRTLARAPTDTRPYLYASFVACALSSSSGFSLWQAWFMFSFALAAIFAVLASSVRP